MDKERNPEMPAPKDLWTSDIIREQRARRALEQSMRLAVSKSQRKRLRAQAALPPKEDN